MATVTTTAPPRHRTRVTEPDRVDSRHLERRLKGKLRGEVRFDAGSRALYSRDASNYRQIPTGVVVPRDVDDVVETVAACREHGAPILARGGGTSLAGQCCNVAVVLDFSKYMHHIPWIDPDQKLARVQPGTILDHLRHETEKHHLTFGPDPATHTHCTFGGMIGNNSCGVHSVMAGRTSENVVEMDILTYDGEVMTVGPTSDALFEHIVRAGGRRAEIYAALRDLRDRYGDEIRRRFPEIPRRVSGYNLPELLPEKEFNLARALVGTECTCALMLEATVQLVDSPRARSLLVIGYPDVFSAGDHVPQILEHGPVGLEGLDDQLARYMREKNLHPEDLRLLPDGGGWLFVEFGGDTQGEANDKARRVADSLKRLKRPPTTAVYGEPDEQSKLWEIRESGLGATAFVPGHHDTWPGWEDSAVPPERVGDYLRDLRGLFDKYGFECSLYGHFGDGCIHTRIDFELRTAEGLAKYRSFAEEAADLVISHGGSFSGEHGDGQARAELLPKMYGEEIIEASREFKSIWDPEWKMNPGKLVDPYPLDEDLALGTDYNPPDVDTHFSFPEDQGDFAHATLRCVGVGKCRRTDGGTMCPSYMVTREEKHTTRGRARLLYEMMQGDVIDGWQSEEVKDALDLCLACKGCKGDCPVNVDMATYKAEFLSHYYEGHWRPRAAWSMGLVFLWARLASRVPNIVNFVGRAPGLSRLTKWIGGIAPQRKLPAFATETFQEWFARRGARPEMMQKVLLWPDTFNNHFHPEVARAAVEVLEDAGFEVMVPQAALCCGRPLYDYGLLDRAKDQLRQILTELQPEIRAGIPLVGLEPSCLAVFRDEMRNLLPHDEDARRLEQQSYTLAEFLTEWAPDYELPKLHRKASVHGHCHHKAVLQMDSDEKVLEQLGLDFEVLDSGCCGMAGSFGFHDEHYEVSVACGERDLIPAVRNTPDDELIITDGFSCQEQIEQLSDRKALHLAQVLQMALRGGSEGPITAPPEILYPKVEHTPRARPLEKAIAVGAGAALGYLAWRLGRKVLVRS